VNRTSALLALFALAALLVSACGDDGGEGTTAPPLPELVDVDAPDPVLVGSGLVGTVPGLALVDEVPALRVDLGDGASRALAVREVDGARVTWAVDATLVDALGAGTHTVDLRLDLDGAPTQAVTLQIATGLDVELLAAPDGVVYRNQIEVLRGSGFVTADEGTVTARVVGTFTGDDGDTAVDASLDVLPAEAGDRDRGLLTLTTDLGGIGPGVFDGTIELVSELRSGATSRSTVRPMRVEFIAPDVFGFEPAGVPLGAWAFVRGAGFVGGRADVITTLALEGTVTRDGVPEAFGPTEVVPEFVDGQTLRIAMEAVASEGQLVSRLFDAREARFEGTATVVVSQGAASITGAPAPVSLQVTPPGQVVVLRFLPSYEGTLRRFGLAAAQAEVEAAVVARVRSIYGGVNLDVRLDEPTDMAPGGWSVVEIGGPDPNGLGVLGYDNSPGKDVGNLRLFDAIGGQNAETQADGYPGYGGIFIESMLYWSSHPDLPGADPAGRPEPDPLFDEIFDPVRTYPATVAEVRGDGDPDRVAKVQRAIAALGSMVGETSAHEIGHSLGLAEPFGPTTVFHNSGDTPGCLMDTGSARPLGERAAQDGFTPTHLCGDHPAYLLQVLGGR